VDPVPDPLVFFSGSTGNRTRASGSVVKNPDHYITEAVNGLLQLIKLIKLLHVSAVSDPDEVLKCWSDAHFMDATSDILTRHNYCPQLLHLWEQIEDGTLIISFNILVIPLWSSGQSSWLHNGDVLCFL
jgi:hypothetical protein